MEDAHSCAETIASLPECAYFGVFDGHGGSRAAEYASKHLLAKIEDALNAETDGQLHEKLEATLPKAFISLDEHLADHVKDLNQREGQECGSTAVAVIITPTHIAIAHLGDARQA